ncbi:hypothetical protein H2203_003702 [Taxawa tesnikishii (nom. ined.)]|nr:hypothetical protein H2203_003702 [Dothideales sp. JES 119]
MTPASLLESFQGLSLHKGSTFHSPNLKKSELFNPFAHPSLPPAMPPRSATCPKELEDLLIGAGERRAADLLKRVDDAINRQSKLALGSILNEPEVLPVPRFMLDKTSFPADDKMHVRQQIEQDDHASDSGLGSSLADSEENFPLQPTKSTITRRSPRSSATAVNYSYSTIEPATVKEECLSDFAVEQIHKFIIKPILREPSLADFHPLLRDVPRRIGDKEIINLRDLEKTLIFLAPAKGEKLDEMDFTPDEHLQLSGGMSHNGKPAELVRKKDDGKTISISTGRTLSDDEDVAAASTKRPMSDEFVDEDGVRRSMARRKKNELPKTYTCKAPGCHKEFKRPCDLTKHVKTHDRPFKCPEENCKYHEYGWPTEKECDRHVNDKHSSSPTLYKCLFHGCPYTSKRESNCKQHMEKSHGWEYVRSKSNGRNKLPLTRLPHASVASTPGSAFATPPTPIAPSPSIHSSSGSDASLRGFLAPPSVQAGFVFSPQFSPSAQADLTLTPPEFFDTMQTPGAQADLTPDLTLASPEFFHAMQSAQADLTPDLTLTSPEFFGTMQMPGAQADLTPDLTLTPPEAFGTMQTPGAHADPTLTSPEFFDTFQMDEGYEGVLCQKMILLFSAWAVLVLGTTMLRWILAGHSCD